MVNDLFIQLCSLLRIYYGQNLTFVRVVTVNTLPLDDTASNIYWRFQQTTGYHTTYLRNVYGAQLPPFQKVGEADEKF